MNVTHFPFDLAASALRKCTRLGFRSIGRDELAYLRVLTHDVERGVMLASSPISTPRRSGLT